MKGKQAVTGYIKPGVKRQQKVKSALLDEFTRLTRPAIPLVMPYQDLPDKADQFGTGSG